MPCAPHAPRAAAALAALALVLGCIAVASRAIWRAQLPLPPPPLILLQRATLRPAARSVALDGGHAALPASDGDAWWDGSCTRAAQFVVALAPPIDGRRRAAVLAELARSGGVMVGYVPQHSFLVLANETTVAHLARCADVQHVARFAPEWRIAPELEDALAGASEGGVLRVELSAVAAPGLRIAAVRRSVAALLGARGAVLDASASGKLLLSLDVAAAPALLQALAAQPYTHWLAPAAEVRVRNYFASALLQGARGAAQAPADAAAALPLWEAGLRGQGQLIGIGDSGIDMRSCYFAHEFNGSLLPPGPEHRKVVAYNALYADGVDGNGHGTHTAGSLAGACAPGSLDATPDAARWNGVAPAARLVFTDLGTGAGGRLFLPSSLSEYFEFSFYKGARIHSDSWGGDSSAYDVLAAEVDDFAWRHRDFLPVFASGNFGGAPGGAHVANPATSKNALAVGATLSGGEAGPPNVRVAELVTLLGEAFRLYLPRMAFADTPLGRAPASRLWELRVADPPDGCTPALPPLRGAVLLLQRGGTCDADGKLADALAAGAVAVLLYNNDSSGFFPLPGGSSARIAAATMPLSQGERLRALVMDAGGRLPVRFAASRASEARADTLAAFSSAGPTRDGRIKPDLVAPGETRSAAAKANADAGGSCDTGDLTGTSMAAPIVAGAAALVRQYFLDGFYPSGAARSADTLAPSGPLVKAVLINGAVALLGSCETGVPLEPPPSPRQGFGRVSLAQQSLPLAATTTDADAVRLFVSDGASLTAGETHRYCLLLAQPPRAVSLTAADLLDAAASLRELRITLGWHDPPAVLAAAGPKLVNDLDLRVTALPPDAAAPAPLCGVPPNRLDNVERCVLPQPEGGAFLVEVEAHAVPWPAADTGGQPYALVATGPGLCGARLRGGAASCDGVLPQLRAGCTAALPAEPPPAPVGCSIWAALFGRSACSSGG